MLLGQFEEAGKRLPDRLGFIFNRATRRQWPGMAIKGHPCVQPFRTTPCRSAMRSRVCYENTALSVSACTAPLGSSSYSRYRHTSSCFCFHRFCTAYHSFSSRRVLLSCLPDLTASASIQNAGRLDSFLRPDRWHSIWSQFDGTVLESHERSTLDVVLCPIQLFMVELGISIKFTSSRPHLYRSALKHSQLLVSSEDLGDELLSVSEHFRLDGLRHLHLSASFDQCSR